MKDTLFPTKPDFRIARLGPDDARRETDHLRVLRSLVCESTGQYPAIETWFTDRVLPGLVSKERTAWVCYEHGEPVVSAIVKRGKKAKFCHLRVKAAFQDVNLGDVFFSLMALEVRHLAREVFFTLPESVWAQRGPFFRSFGFTEPKQAQRQYRSGEVELCSTATFDTVWRHTLGKLPKLRSLFTIAGRTMDVDVVLSLRPEYAELILSGKKTVEFRKRFSEKLAGKRLAIYAGKPVGGLVGEAGIESVVSGEPGRIWEQFSSRAGAPYEAFAQYVGGASEVTAIALRDVYPYVSSIPLAELDRLVDGELSAPQSYLTPTKNSDWSRAVAVAVLLQAAHSAARVFPPH